MPRGVYVRTAEARANISAALKGKGHPQSAETRARIGAANTRHGYNRRVTGKSLIYSTWESMIKRCTNPKATSYKDYGGRGITVCDRWRVFENFLADMGEKPIGLTLDRIDNDGNYECGFGPAFGPGNCHWATRFEQTHNRRQRAAA